MKKKLIALLITATMALSLTACGGSGDDKKEDTKTEETAKEDTKEESKEDEATYESILADYTAKLQDATPGLVDEFNSEAAEKAGKPMVHSMVKRVIRNICYIGDDFYPAIVSRQPSCLT